MKWSSSNIILVSSVGITALLYFIPFGNLIAYPLILISTMAHEFGHGVAALLVGGHFDSYTMWPDASGQAALRHSGGAFSQAFIAAGGLVGPSIVAALLYVVAAYPRWCRAALYSLAVVLILAEILVIRGWFAMSFALASALAILLLAQQKSSALAQFSLVFVAVQLSLSVFSRSDYLFTRTALTSNGQMPSDVLQIEQALWLPYWFWGALCGAFSVFTLLLGLRFYIKNARQ